MLSFLFSHVFSLLPVRENVISTSQYFIESPNSSTRYQEIGSGWFEILEALVKNPPREETVLHYLKQTLDLNCVERESSLLYGGGYYWTCENTNKRLRVTIVAAGWLGWQIPKKYRKTGWYYVKMIFPIGHKYESVLESCYAVDAKHYEIQ